jgi:hypothetical protein
MSAVVSAHAQKAEPLSALARMPVKELTVFKDGHAFVLHEGRMPTDAAGNVQMDYLPTPIMGAFWPYSADKSVKLSAVRASPRRVLVSQTGLTLQELLAANPGAAVTVTDVDGKSYPATLIGIPTRSSQELDAANPPGSPPSLPVSGNVILMKTAEGTVVKPLDRIRSVAFKGAHNAKVATEVFRNLLTLKLEWPNQQPGRSADVGMMYLQKGLRWIPGYKVSIDGKGNASIKMQATLINEMVDLSDVTMNLVIGVPSFFFKDTLDPIGAQQAMAQLSPYVQTDTRSGFAMSNSIMGQAARAGERMGGMGGFGGGGGGFPAAPPEAGPEIGGTEKNEDLFVFTVKHVTLKRGERMVLPVTEFTLKYRDVYTLELPFGPPPEMRSNLNSDQQTELARLMAAPKAMHKIRLENRSAFPLTTAPALILNGDRLISQAMMTYTSVGGTVDAALTTAVDIKVKKSEKEAERAPNDVSWRDHRYGRVTMEGLISLTNYGPNAVDVEVTRYVLGQAESATADGKVSMINAFEDGSFTAPEDLPVWWRWYSWPWWWWHFNGVGKFEWTARVEPGKTADLGYKWRYYWE